MKSPRLLLALIFLITQIACARPDSSIEGGKDRFTMPFELVDNRVFVEVTLDGKGPFNFILDTGAVAALDQDTVRKLNLTAKESGAEHGVGENVVQSGETEIRQVKIGSLILRNIPFNVVPLDTPDVFGTKHVDGVIGLPVFENFVVKYDYVQHNLTFCRPEKFSYAETGTIIPFKRPEQIPLVTATLDGVKGDFGIDTGARSSLLLYAPFVAHNQLREKYEARLEGVTGWGIGGPVRSLLARARELKIGPLTVSGIVIRLSTQKSGLTTSSGKAGLIGPDVLSQFDVTFDYSRERIIFKKNANFGRPDSYDRAGLWMGQESGSHFDVVDVIAGGPADAAGIQTGDTILAINGQDTSTLFLPDVRERIRRTPPGAKLTLLLKSAGKQRTATITLRDLV